MTLVSRRGLSRLLAVAVVACACQVAADPAGGSPEPAAPAQTPTAPPPAPLSLKDFLTPPQLLAPTLSPSGKAVAMVRRIDDIDQILRVDMPDLKTTVLFQTNRLAPELVKRKFRQSVTYLDWKSDDVVVASIDTPVREWIGYDKGITTAPVHVVLDAHGKTPALYLNASEHGKSATVELSWIQSLLKDDPAHVMIGYRKSVYMVELDKVAIADGSRTLLETGGPGVVSYGTDRAGDTVTRVLRRDDGGRTLQVREPGQSKWTKIFDYRPRRDERALAKFELLGMGGPSQIYVGVKPETPADGDTTAVRIFDLKTMTLGPVVWSNAHYDVDFIIQDQETQAFAAGCYWADTLECDFKSPRLAAHFKGLNRFFDDKRSLSIISQSDDDTKWLIAASGPDEPASYFVYDVTAHHLDQLGVAWADLSAARLGTMRKLEFKTRDGVALWAYVTEPPGANGRPPLVVMPHGGPEARDVFGYDMLTQFLATRGYVVLQPMFRGSGGLGRKFAEAGYGQWGGRMHDDVMDATRALIAEGEVDPGRVCVVGGSYGGTRRCTRRRTSPGPSAAP